MKRKLSLFVMVTVLLAGVTFSVFAQSYDPDDTTDSTASDYLQLSPATSGGTIVNTAQWIGVFRDAATGVGTAGDPVLLDGGQDGDTTWELNSSTSYPGEAATSSTGSATAGTPLSTDGMLRYSVLYSSGTLFDISVKAASAPTSTVEVYCTGVYDANAVGDIGTAVSEIVILSGSDQQIISDIGGSSDTGGSDFVANDGTSDYFEAYTGTAAGDGANIYYNVTNFAGSTEDIQVIYTISAQ